MVISFVVMQKNWRTGGGEWREVTESALPIPLELIGLKLKFMGSPLLKISLVFAVYSKWQN